MLVVGAGVAGLAAIGTSVSLGAITYAFDVRPEVAEQIESIGAEFVFLEFEGTHDGATTSGYAAPSSPEFREAQLAKFRELAAFQKETRNQVALLAVGTLLLLLVGSVAPESFMAHFVVFVLACFVGFQVIWNVSHSLHTPLMAVTNAVSGIIILGSILQIGAGGGGFAGFMIVALSTVSILIATINIVGGFLVTRRMLAMFPRS